MFDRAVALLLQLDKRTMNVQIFLNRTDSFQTRAGMRRFANDPQGKSQRTSLGRDSAATRAGC
jgi:hypothetical protein